MPTTSLYQFLGITGGGSVAGILIAINASVVVGAVVFLLCAAGAALTLKAMKDRDVF